VCGICGILVHRPAKAGADESAVHRMTESLRHRGPDGRSVYADPSGSAYLGHTRLAIVDLSAKAAQPMRNETSSLVLVVNGEIYNHRELRGALESKGHVFRSQSDSEVILHLYEEHGSSFVERLDGMFALALWDAALKRLLLARDRLGKKPLYYVETPDRFLFASSPRALLAHGSVSAEPSAEGIRHYLTFNCAPAPHTLFREIRKLPAAWRLTIGSSGRVKAGPYWDFTGPPLDGIGESVAAERLRDLLEKAVRKRMMSDVPLGAYLSGGLDSTIVVDLMRRSATKRLRTFALGYDGKGDEDLPFAERVASLNDTDHEALGIREESLAESIDLLAEHSDDPVGAPSCLSNLLLARRTRKAGVPVVQVGEGADELFFGYRPNRRSLLVHRFFWSHFGRLPRRVRGGLHRLLDRPLTLVGDPTVEHSLDATLRECFRRSASDEPVHWGFANVFSETAKKNLAPGLRPEESSFAPLAAHFARIEEEGWDLATALTYIDLKVGLAERLLMRVDKMNMAFAVEARAPFLDREAAEFAFRLPSYLKLMHGGKGILRSAYRDRLPADIVRRKKRGFPTPASVFLGGKLLPIVESKVLSSRLLRDGLLARGEVTRLFAENRRGATARFYPIWSLFVLALWHERWVEGTKVPAISLSKAREGEEGAGARAR
jgi:asparagine synthase (glutamine-hydrolysing)